MFKVHMTRTVSILLTILLVVLVINVVFFATEFKIGFFHRWVEDQYFGNITEISEGAFIILNQEANEKVILITKQTTIRQGRQVMSEDALQVGTRVIVAGVLDSNGEIEARVIRIFPKGNLNVK